MARLSWRKQPDETGLRIVGQSERGFELRYAGETIGYVSPLSSGWGKQTDGWYFVARSESYNVPLINTCSRPCGTKEEAKAACDKYVREHFKPATGEQR